MTSDGKKQPGVAANPVSAAKIAANRRNAQKSTGPKTTEGKQASRWNALRHGMLSKVLAASEAMQTEQWARLVESLGEDCKPVGVLEEIVIEKIALNYWRLQRAVANEAVFVHSQGAFWADPAKFGRYITAIQRALSQDLRELERLQRYRQGDYVPPPISIDVSVSGGDVPSSEEMLAIATNTGQVVDGTDPKPHLTQDAQLPVGEDHLLQDDTVEQTASETDRHIHLEFPNEATAEVPKGVGARFDCEKELSASTLRDP